MRARVFLAAAILTALAGCTSPDIPPAGTGVAASLGEIVRCDGPLRVAVLASQPAYEPGEVVNASFFLVNEGSEAVNVSGTGVNATIYRHLGGTELRGVLSMQVEALSAGEPVTVPAHGGVRISGPSGIWNGRLPDGGRAPSGTYYLAAASGRACGYGAFELL